MYSRVFSCLFALALPCSFPARASEAGGVSGDDVTLAIDRAVSFLETVQRPEGRWLSLNCEHAYPNAASALGAYTLHRAGKPASYWRIAKVARAFKNRSNTHTAFARANTLALFQSLGQKDFAPAIKEDIRYLIWQQSQTGGWGEPWILPEEGNVPDEQALQRARRKKDTPRYVEPVASFMALRGMREAVAAGEPVNFVLWNREEAIGIERANEDGGWPYITHPDASISQPSDAAATAARLASLYDIYDVRYLETALRFNGRFMARCGEPSDKSAPLLQAIENAWSWIDGEFDPGNFDPGKWNSTRTQPSLFPPLDSQAFYLFAVSEAALSAGRTHIGGEWWPEAISKALIRRQEPDGSWRTVEATCFGILALLNCQKPVLVSRVEVEPDKYWHRTPRDVINLARKIGSKRNATFAWQRVDVSSHPSLLFDAPIAYVTGHDFPAFDESTWNGLVSYVERGGTLLGIPCCSSEAFSDGFRKAVDERFPRLAGKKIDGTHDMFLLEDAPGTIPDLTGWSDGLRTSVFLLNVPAGCTWQQDMFSGRDYGPWFETFEAMLSYATFGRGTPAREPGYLPEPAVSQVPADAQGSAGQSNCLSISVLRHEGDWWIKPAAIDRLAEEMHGVATLCVRPGNSCSGADLRRVKPDIAWVTGTRFEALTAADRAECKAYLASGGTIVASPAGGAREFDAAFRAFMTSMYGNAAWERIPPDDPILTGNSSADEGVTLLESVAFRQPFGASANVPEARPEVWGVKSGERWAVLYVPHDLVSILLNEACLRCAGYTRDDSLSLLRNILHYTGVQEQP